MFVRQLYVQIADLNVSLCAYIIVTTCDVGEGVKGSVTSHTSHLWKGTIDNQIHVANSPYVSGRETFRNAALNFTQFYALN